MNAVKILFVQGNTHNNQCMITKALVQAGYQVFYAHAGLEEIKPHPGYASECNWLRLRYGWLTRLLAYFLERQLIASKSDFFRYWRMPSFVDTWRICIEVRPDVVVVKRFFPFFAVFSLVARAFGIKVMIYDQKGLFSHRSGPVGAFLEKIKIKPRVRYTPVIGYQEMPGVIRLKGAYIPFVAPQEKEGLGRTYCKNGRVSILMVGEVSKPRKRAKDLIKAFIELAPRYPIDLTIIGANPEAGKAYLAELFQVIAKKGFANRVTLTSGLDWVAMREAYLTHDIFVLPSIEEPASYSQLEAMALGMPVILSNRNKSRCYVHQGINGELFEGKNWHDLMLKIETFLLDYDRIKVMGQASALLARKRYGPDVFIRRIRRLLKMVEPT